MYSLQVPNAARSTWMLGNGVQTGYLDRRPYLKMVGPTGQRVGASGARDRTVVSNPDDGVG